MRKGKETSRPDRRKIPQLFRAVERDERPTVYFGILISDDLFNFVSFSCHVDDGSHLRERVLRKSEFVFSRADRAEFELHARSAIQRMKRETEDKKLELEAASYKQEYAEAKFSEVLGKI